MWCLLWINTDIYLALVTEVMYEYHVILDRIMTALDCLSIADAGKILQWRKSQLIA